MEVVEASETGRTLVDPLLVNRTEIIEVRVPIPHYATYRINIISVDRSPGRDDRPERPKEDSDSRGDSGRTSSSSRVLPTYKHILR